MFSLWNPVGPAGNSLKLGPVNYLDVRSRRADRLNAFKDVNLIVWDVFWTAPMWLLAEMLNSP